MRFFEVLFDFHYIYIVVSVCLIIYSYVYLYILYKLMMCNYYGFISDERYDEIRNSKTFYLEAKNIITNCKYLT